MPSKKSIKHFEFFIAFFLIVLLWYYGFDAYQKMIYNSKAASTAQELKTIKQAIYMYVVKYKTYPKSLNELYEKKIINFEGKLTSSKYINNKKIDERGNLLDPFGNPYYYNPKTGEVKSTTAGFDDY